MKKRQFKLLASIVSLTLVFAVMAVGIIAAASVSVTVTNTVKYTATSHVRATLTSTMRPGGENTDLTGGNEPDAKTLGINEETTATGNTFALGEITLTIKSGGNQGPEDTVQLVHTFTIKNEASSTATNKYLKIVITDTTLLGALSTPNSINVVYTGVTGAGNNVVIDAGETLTMTITATINVNTSATPDLGFGIALSAQASSGT